MIENPNLGESNPKGNGLSQLLVVGPFACKTN